MQIAFVSLKTHGMKYADFLKVRRIQPRVKLSASLIVCRESERPWRIVPSSRGGGRGKCYLCCFVRHICVSQGPVRKTAAIASIRKTGKVMRGLHQRGLEELTAEDGRGENPETSHSRKLPYPHTEMKAEDSYQRPRAEGARQKMKPRLVGTCRPGAPAGPAEGAVQGRTPEEKYLSFVVPAPLPPTHSPAVQTCGSAPLQEKAKQANRETWV